MASSDAHLCGSLLTPCRLFAYRGPRGTPVSDTPVTMIRSTIGDAKVGKGRG